jgi:hypothetical protein
MSDNKQDRGPRDRSRIDINEDYEVRYWTKELNISPEQLKQAVNQVGPMVENVRKHLKK